MRVLMISGEANPFVKTGGLADVCYSLAKSLVRKNNEVSIVLPFYKKIKDKLFFQAELIKTFPVYMSWRVQYCGIYKYVYENITYYFIDNEQYFYREGIYGFDDDIERFAYFDLAVVEMLIHLDMNFDILHLHDWQTGMVPLLFKADYRVNLAQYNPKFVFTIHNPAFQGKFDPYYLGDFFNLSYEYYDNGTVRFDNCCSFLKTAIVLSDKITTVSCNHAKELMRGEHAYGLEQVIKYRTDDFIGIENGIDYDEFDPKNDKSIAFNYDISNAYSNKKKNKELLLKEFNIKNPNLPLFCVVSRLTFQKGIGLILDAIPHISGKANIFILGSGEKELEDRSEFLRKCYSENVAVYFGYNDNMAHRIYAACDFFLMPSLYEPCGIGQMIAHHYGALPIVRNTGGLVDTVIGYDGTNSDYADGFSFNDYALQGLLGPCMSAIDVYNHKDLHLKLMKNAMLKKHDWDSSCDSYIALYNDLLK